MPHGQRNYIIGFPKPIIGVFVKLDSKEVRDRLKKFDLGYNTRRDRKYHRLHIANKEKHDSYIPVENILAYETPKRFTERRNGFTGYMLVDWPPTVEWVESITRIPMKSVS